MSHSNTSQKRRAIISMALLLLVSGTAIWVLSLVHILATFWTPILGAIFTALGAIFALLQWLWPTPATRPASTPGALRVLVRPQLCGSTIHVCDKFHSMPGPPDLAANVMEVRNGNQPEFVAEFPEMKPGSYTVFINAQGPIAHVTIFAGRTSLIDWRAIHP